MNFLTCLKAVDSKIVRGNVVLFESGRVVVEWDDIIQTYKNIEELKAEAEVNINQISTLTISPALGLYDYRPSIYLR